MIASAIAVTILGITAYFIVESTRATLKGTAISQNNMDQWSLTSRLMLDSRQANGMAIYDDLVTTSLTFEKRITTPTSQGNLLIFSRSYIPSGSNPNTNPSYSRIIGYLYKEDKKTLYKFEYEVSSAEQTPTPASLEDILINNKGNFSLEPQADGIEPIKSGGKVFYFLAPSYAHIAFLAREGTNKLTKDAKLIEASFIVRN
ncbi:hypothetical protein DB347_19085 [Opitutaceae bacterium EW11]|nr:hypothetical protein DB347_19085 [Opitutaceae bacterium EW11]